MPSDLAPTPDAPTRPDGVRTDGVRTDGGFTLVEIVIAIVLVGILSAVVVVGVGQLTSRGTAASCAASADAARAGSVAHFSDNGTWPTTFTQMTASGSLQLPAGATTDPDGTRITVGGSSGWTLVLAPGTAGAQPGFSCLDPGGVTTAQPGTLPVAGATLWLDASATASITTTGSNVTRWTDLSDSGADATATASTGPTVASAGGRPYLSFNGTDQQMAVSLPGSKSTIIAVVRSNETTWVSHGSVLENRSGGRIGNIFEWRSTRLHWNPSPTAARRNGVALSAPFDLAPVDQFMVLTVFPSWPTASSNLGIGALENRWYSPIHLAELVVYPQVLAGTDLAQVEQALMTKWGITP